MWHNLHAFISPAIVFLQCILTIVIIFIIIVTSLFLTIVFEIKFSGVKWSFSKFVKTAS